MHGFGRAVRHPAQCSALASAILTSAVCDQDLLAKELLTCYAGTLCTRQHHEELSANTPLGAGCLKYDKVRFFTVRCRQQMPAAGM